MSRELVETIQVVSKVRLQGTYRPGRSRGASGVRHIGRVLIVTDDVQTRDFCAASVGSVGYETNACPGPGSARDCPRLHGIRCTLRESVEVAVVDLDCDESVFECVKVPDDGGTVFVRRSASSPTGRGGLLLAVEDANRHVQDLHSPPVVNAAIPALDLD